MMIIPIVPCRAENSEPPPRVLTAEEIAGLDAAHRDPLPGLAAEAEGILQKFSLPEDLDGVPQWMHPAPPGDPVDTDYEAWGRMLAENKESLRSLIGLSSDLNQLPAGRALHKLATPTAKAQADKVAALLESTRSRDVWLVAAETLGHMRAIEYAPVIAETTIAWPGWGVTRLMRVLEKMQGRECADLLVSMLDRPVFNNGTYQEIMLILEGFDDPRCVDAAIAYIGYSGTRDRADALRVLSKFGNPRLAPRLLHLLEKGSSGIRAGVVGELKPADQAWLESNDARVRAQAIEALGVIGCREAKSAIVRMLDAAQPIPVRLQAMKSLSALGSPEYADQVASLLTRSVPDRQRREVLSALAEMNWKAKVPEVTALLTADEPKEIRVEALKAIGELGTWENTVWQSPLVDLTPEAKAKAALEVLAFLKESGTLQSLVEQLKDGDSSIQVAALQTLAEIGYDGPVDVILSMLLSPEREVQRAALKVLKAASDPAVNAAIAGLLADSDWEEISDSLTALKERKATEHAGAVFALLKQPLPDRRQHQVVWIQNAVLDTLIALRAVDQQEQMLALLNSEDSSLRLLAVRFLTALDLREAIPAVTARLLDGVESVRRGALIALLNKGHMLGPRLVLPYLEAAARFPEERPTILAAAYFHFGGVEPQRTALRWLGGRDDNERPAVPHSVQEVRAVVDAALTVCPAAEAEAYPGQVFEAGALAAELIAATAWSPSDAGWLGSVAEDLRRRGFREISSQVLATAQEARARHPLRRAVRMAMWTLLIQPVVWILVLLAYPWSALAQGMVWSRWVRRIAGFGWVGPVVVRVPWLRERMWRPFREALVPPGEVVSFDEWTFFDAVRVTREGGESQPTLRVLEARGGVTVLRGESGLGKTTLLQALAGRSERAVALLRAVECGAGLVEALRGRLPRRARGDAAFLRALVMRGSPDILVDAVHETLPEVRAKLSEEIASLPGANVLLTTQPVEWSPPAGAAVWTLEPLWVQDISPFLLKQGTAAVEAAGAGSLAERQRAFAARAAAFLDELEMLPPESARAVSLRRMLGNPMEAVLAAELLAAGQTPDPDRLLEQRMEHLTADYTAEHGGEFPASAFAEHLRSWRSSGAPLLRLDLFAGVASFLARHRLLRKMADGAEAWRFRHDKIMEWFLRPAGRLASD